MCDFLIETTTPRLLLYTHLIAPSLAQEAPFPHECRALGLRTTSDRLAST